MTRGTFDVIFPVLINFEKCVFIGESILKTKLSTISKYLTLGLIPQIREGPEKIR